MVSEVQRIQNRSGLGSAQMARLLGVSVRMLVR
jgi:DNA-binding transcriptional regulator YiaG